MEYKHFSELSAASFSGQTVILDVDGTLVGDGEHDMDEQTEKKLIDLASVASVYLCSNAQGVDRLKQISEKTGVRYVVSKYKKPNVRSVDAVPNLTAETGIVIGDRYLTDGLLATFLGVEFFKVKRIRTSREHMYIRMLYAIDELIGKVVWSTVSRFFV